MRQTSTDTLPRRILEACSHRLSRIGTNEAGASFERVSVLADLLRLREIQRALPGGLLTKATSVTGNAGGAVSVDAVPVRLGAQLPFSDRHRAVVRRRGV